MNEERKCHIITIEDPIEYLHKHKNGIIDQREIGLTQNFCIGVEGNIERRPDVIQGRDEGSRNYSNSTDCSRNRTSCFLNTTYSELQRQFIGSSIHFMAQQNQSKVGDSARRCGVSAVDTQTRWQRSGSGGGSKVDSAIRNLIREVKPYQINRAIQTDPAVECSRWKIHWHSLYQ